MGSEELSVQIHHLTWADLEAIARLHRAAEPVDGAGQTRDIRTLLQQWRQSQGRLQEECLVAEAGGVIVGYAIRSAVPGTDQHVIDGVVHPEWRRRGIGRRLVARVAEEVRLCGGRTLDLRARDDDPATVAFCEAVGFRLARRWLRMWLEPLRMPSFPFPEGYSWRYFRPHHDEPAYAQIVTETFDGHWGLGPTTVERVRQLVDRPGFVPEDILLALCRREVVGLCTVRLAEREVGGRRFVAAHIGPLSVRAAHRGRGLGHALVAHSLRRCQRRHIPAAELDVDEGNSAAIHLYEVCGFRTLFHTLWYRQEVAPLQST